jgi:alkyl hydroperoxide reductase subunit AhpC
MSKKCKCEEECDCCDGCTCDCCENKPPMIGGDAPAFKANTTQGEINFPGDFAGKWIILFSHPADFTPVCTTEFMTFASMAEEFEALNVQLVGLSVDSIYAHIAWLRKIQDIDWNGMSNVEVKFPLIEDIKMDVAKKYGMIQPAVSDIQAVRSVFFIDPNGKIRAMIHYPPSLGRNFADQEGHRGPPEGRRREHRHPRQLDARGRRHSPRSWILWDREGENGFQG